VRAGEKTSISTNRKSTTCFPTSHRWTMYVTPKSPKRWQKQNAILQFCHLPGKFNFCPKKSATKLLCVKTSSGKVVATSFPYLTVHRWLRATSSSIWNRPMRSKWSTPSENTDYKKLDFKFGVHVDHSKFQPTDDKLSLKGAWSLSRDLFNFWKISNNISKTV